MANKTNFWSFGWITGEMESMRKYVALRHLRTYFDMVIEEPQKGRERVSEWKSRKEGGEGESIPIPVSSLGPKHIVSKLDITLFTYINQSFLFWCKPVLVEIFIYCNQKHLNCCVVSGNSLSLSET